jgi:Protein of unknown function (DUF551)
MSHWIKIHHEKPKNLQWVLVLSNEITHLKLYEDGIFYDGDTCCYCPVGEIHNVSHWMPLPHKPNE